MTDPRPRLLFLSQTLPFPPDGGVKIRTFNILRLLARTFDVTALCFYRSKGGELRTDVSGALAGLAPYARVEAFAIPQERSRARFLADHLRSALTLRAYTVYSYGSGDFRRRLRELLDRESFDLVHADSLDLSGYFPALDGLPVVCVHHDAQSILLARRAAVEESMLRRWYLAFQSRLMLREERRWCPRVNLNVAVSEVDREKLQAHAPGSPFSVVPNGVDTDLLAPRGPGRGGVVFVGGTTWFPNLDALQYFEEAILPELRRSGVEVPVTWVGRATEREREEYGRRSGIRMTGYVTDIREEVADALCYVVPLRIGGGTRIKILDAWAMGKAIVSTRIGCEGLDARDGENILIRDDPASFAEAIRQVLVDPNLRGRLELEGRRTVERSYSWESLEPAMRADYLGLIARAHIR